MQAYWRDLAELLKLKAKLKVQSQKVMQPEYLFVYGTLLRDIGHPMAEFLARQARFVGDAKMPGRLYDLGPYPGMREPENVDDWVHGELYELRNAAVTLEDDDPLTPAFALYGYLGWLQEQIVAALAGW